MVDPKKTSYFFFSFCLVKCLYVCVKSSQKSILFRPKISLNFKALFPFLGDLLSYWNTESQSRVNSWLLICTAVYEMPVWFSCSIMVSDEFIRYLRPCFVQICSLLAVYVSIGHTLPPICWPSGRILSPLPPPREYLRLCSFLHLICTPPASVLSIMPPGPGHIL